MSMSASDSEDMDQFEFKWEENAEVRLFRAQKEADDWQTKFIRLKDDFAELERNSETSRNKLLQKENELSEMAEKVAILEGKSEELQEWKDCGRHISAVLSDMLEELGGTSPLDREEENVLTHLGRLCESVQNRLADWKEGHLRMHAELERTLEAAETVVQRQQSPMDVADVSKGEENKGLAEDNMEEAEFQDESEIDLPSISGWTEAGSWTFSTLSELLAEHEQDPLPGPNLEPPQTGRQNPARACKSANASYAEEEKSDDLDSSPPLGCGPCCGFKKRLARLTGSLSSPNSKNADVAAWANAAAVNGMTSVNGRHYKGSLIANVLVDHVGTKHTYGGILLPSEEPSEGRGSRLSQKGGSKRVVCTCGRDYASKSGLHMHLKAVKLGTFVTVNN